jgi:glycerol-3-phosphate responsive antiterminator
VLVADDGRHPLNPPAVLQAGVLLRHADLPVVVARAALPTIPLALDIDTVRGLEADEAGVAFVIQRLAISIVLTRRPQMALRAAELGGLGLVHVLAFDSTGLRRALEGHPRRDGVGTVVSPGLVLDHMTRSELETLPRPILAYGLITEASDAAACLRLADAVVLRAGTAAALAELIRTAPDTGMRPLTTVAAEE